MSRREKLGQSSPDQRDLASSVLALTRAASASHAASGKRTADRVAQLAEGSRPQLELDWEDPFTMQICSGEELEIALAHARASADDNPAVEAFLSQLQKRSIERTLSPPPTLEAN